MMVGKVMNEIEERSAITCWQAVLELTSEEASTVTILSGDADFEPDYDYAIDVRAVWTDWKEKRFTGNSVMDCLLAACIEKAEYIPEHMR